MPITDTEGWKKAVENNTDPYGKACIDVARRAMEILDKEPGDFECHDLICRADNDSNNGGITSFMAGCVASIVSQVHSRGDEFRKKWNLNNQMQDEGAKVDEGRGVLNPILLSLRDSKQGPPCKSLS